MARTQPPRDRAQRAAAMQRQVGDAVLTRPSLAGVNEYSDLGRDHVPETVQYEQNPPTGGDHNQPWWNCGIYADPIPAHHSVHSLEHGAVWLTYRPNLSEDDRQKLLALADPEFILLSPNDTQTAPVIASAWGRQIELESADDERLPLLVSEYRQGPQTPEPGAVCTGGTTTGLVATS